MEKLRIETPRLIIRGISNEDFDLCCQISRENYFPQIWQDRRMSEIYDQTLWDSIQKVDTLNGIIVEKSAGKSCGRVCIQNLDQEIPEIGIDILKEYQRIGIGAEATAAFCNWYHKKFAVHRVLVRIDKTNAASRCLFEKLGAKFEGSHSFITDKTLKLIKEYLPNENTAELEAEDTLHYYLELPVGCISAST